MQFTDVQIKYYGVTVAPDKQEFRIEATVVDPGELPVTAAFVFTIGVEDDPSTDSFARVAYPQDLQNLLVSRDLSISAGATEYLSSYAEFQYTTLTDAVNAKAMLSTRLNELVKNWLTYQNDFVDDSDVVRAYPNSDPEVEDTLKQNYSDAVEAREAAEVAVTAADTALSSAQDAATTAQEFVAKASECVAFIQDFTTKVNEYKSLVVSEGTSATTYYTSTLLPALSDRGSVCNSDLQTAQNELTAAESDIATKTQTKIEAEQTLVAAQEAEDEALAAVLAVCPDFDPSSV